MIPDIKFPSWKGKDAKILWDELKESVINPLNRWLASFDHDVPGGRWQLCRLTPADDFSEQDEVAWGFVANPVKLVEYLQYFLDKDVPSDEKIASLEKALEDERTAGEVSDDEFLDNHRDGLECLDPGGWLLMFRSQVEEDDFVFDEIQIPTETHYMCFFSDGTATLSGETEEKGTWEEIFWKFLKIIVSYVKEWRKKDLKREIDRLNGEFEARFRRLQSLDQKLEREGKKSRLKLIK